LSLTSRDLIDLCDEVEREAAECLKLIRATKKLECGHALTNGETVAILNGLGVRTERGKLWSERTIRHYEGRAIDKIRKAICDGNKAEISAS